MYKITAYLPRNDDKIMKKQVIIITFPVLRAFLSYYALHDDFTVVCFTICLKNVVICYLKSVIIPKKVKIFK